MIRNGRSCSVLCYILLFITNIRFPTRSSWANVLTLTILSWYQSVKSSLFCLFFGKFITIKIRVQGGGERLKPWLNKSERFPPRNFSKGRNICTLLSFFSYIFSYYISHSAPHSCWRCFTVVFLDIKVLNLCVSDMFCVIISWKADTNTAADGRGLCTRLCFCHLILPPF